MACIKEIMHLGGKTEQQ